MSAEARKIREIKKIRILTNKRVEVGEDFKTWLTGEALKLSENNSDVYLLSFHDDGVVWGTIKGGTLQTSDVLKDSAGNVLKTPSPEFRADTLQQCRVFSTKGELFIWRSGNGFKARLIEDKKDAPEDEMKDEFFDEKQVLWGTQTESGNEDFTIVADGSEGLHHAFPMPKSEIETKFSNDTKELKRPLRLRVRHYLDYDTDDCAYISFSRLVKVEVQGE